ncbi:hypothetical protein PVAND_008321 [Polypedilum vanderplanki]|uniref:Chitin-binding type-2 domain-containing protein n=1 Tax=Polypedilum vanderplanki TaxID=319348 RepID=A0A9J6C943_POLVA|nr:hypothetical protein PVAND_008321 [Polypedilum vanderplanki]
MRRGYLFFIILLIGLNNLSANEDITEAISETVQEIVTTTQIDDETKDSLKSDNDEQEEMKIQNPTVQRLPADSETIRNNIIDSQFSCDEREPGFYADIENDCQIFHRCLQERKEVFSFICPEQTVFDQRILVCISDDDFDIPCSASDQYYRESNRAFFGNATAELSMEENIKNSVAIKNVNVIEQTMRPLKEEVKLYEILPTESDLLIEEEDEAEKNSIEIESTSQESNDYQAELIPSSSNHIDASLATSSNSELEESLSLDESLPPQKLITLSVLDPIVELPNDEPVTIRNLQKRSKSHRNRFLFRADSHHAERI